MKYRKMKSSYGNCSISGVITLNVMLMKTQLENIDYVIAHELCHLRCWAHDFEFYSRLDPLCRTGESEAQPRERLLDQVTEDGVDLFKDHHLSFFVGVDPISLQ